MAKNLGKRNQKIEASVQESRNVLKNFLKGIKDDKGKSIEQLADDIKKGKKTGRVYKNTEKGQIKEMEGDDILDKGGAGRKYFYWKDSGDEKILVVKFKGTLEFPLAIKVDREYIEFKGEVNEKHGHETLGRKIEASIPIPDGVTLRHTRVEKVNDQTHLIFPKK